jgi:hypothetical protein
MFAHGSHLGWRSWSQLMHLIATFSQHMDVPPLIFPPKGVKKDFKSGLINTGHS